MTLINLIALYAGAFLLMWCLTDVRFFQFLGTVLLVSFILRNEWRSLMLFIVKPEHLFAAFMTGTGYLTLRWLAVSESRLNEEASGAKASGWMAAGWALAASTKLSVIFCGPGLLSLWFPWDSARRRSLWIFTKRVFLLYLVIGFPQNLDVVGYVKYLLHQSSQTGFVTWKFLSEDWWPLFTKDFLGPASLLVLMVLWVPVRESSVLPLSRRAYARFAVYLFLSFAFLFSKEARIPHEWYPFPLVNQAWLLLSFCLVELSTRWAPRFPGFFRMRRHVLYPFAVMAIVPFAAETFPSGVFQTYRNGMTCREGIREAQARIDKMALEGHRILTDPFAPADFQISRGLRTVKGSWNMNWAEVEAFKADSLAFKEPYGQVLAADPVSLAEVRKFYGAFLSGRELVVDPRGVSWRRVYRNECGFSIWEKN